MRSSAARRSGIIIGFGIIILISGFAIAWLGGYGYLPLDPSFVVGASIVLFFITLILSSSTMMASTSFIARQNTSAVPDSPKNGILNRVIRDTVTGEEIIIRAHPSSSASEVLRDDWPFKTKRSDNWYLVDEDGNDVTNWPISNWDGIAIIHTRE
ncbi:MAG: hypothetical protein ACFFEE_03650 [Candidatus Thorarchaeota archaeon]